MIPNALSIDLESFIHRELNLGKRIKRDAGFTVSATKYLLNLLESHKTRGTFFIVGEIYEWYPGLVEEIKSRGHEIGYHSHQHILLENKTILREELNLSKEFLEKYKPIGFRAPRMNLKKEYLPILRAHGFEYDSSTYSLLPKKPFGSKIKEVSVPFFGSGLTISFLQKRTQTFIRCWNNRGQPVTLCVHPWQFSITGDKIPEVGSIWRRFIYQRKIDKVVEYLLSMNSFVPIREILKI